MGVTVDTKGKAVANGGVTVGDNGVSGSGMIDVDEDLNVEAVGGSAAVKLAEVEAEIGAAVHFAVPQREGCTVSWSWGGSGDVSGKVAGIGGELGADRSDAQSITFATEAEAQAYLDVAKREGAEDLAEATAVQVDALEPGTSLSYTQSAGMTVGASFVGGLTGDARGSREVVIQKSEGGRVQMLVTHDARAGATMAADGGLLGATESTHATSKEQWAYELDLSDPKQREAFDAFQQGQGLDPAFRRDGESMQGVEQKKTAKLPWVNLAHASTREDGTIVRDGDAFDARRGTNSFESNGLTRYDPLKSLADAMTFASGLDIDPNRGAMGLAAGEALGAWAEQKELELLRDAGSVYGREHHKMDAMVPEGTNEEDAWGAVTLLQDQRFEFSDRREASASLHDQVTAGTDRGDLDAASLPASEASDRTYVLQTEIDPEGSLEVMKFLRKKSDLGTEWGAMTAVIKARQAFLMAGGNPAAFGRFVQTIAADGGEDALETVRDIAGAEHMTQYLLIEGDPVFIGREGNKKLDDRLGTLRRRLEAGEPAGQVEAQALIEAERGRYDSLQSGNGYLEVPTILRATEAQRCLSRISDLEGLK